VGKIVTSEEEINDLTTLNKLDELLKQKPTEIVAQVAAITRSARRRRQPAGALQEALVQRMRIDRIRQAQDEEAWIVSLKAYLLGDASGLTADEAKSCAKIADDYEVDEADLLFYCPASARQSEERDTLTRLVVPRPCNKISCIIITPAWKGAIRESAGHTSGSDRTSIGEGCTGVSSAMWENAQTVRQGRDGRSGKENRQGTYKLRTCSRSWPWTTSRRCRSPSKATPSCSCGSICSRDT
jgi:hypothetical protein